MAKKLYEETDIQAIADSIRGKCGTTCGYKVCDMADAIADIPTSGGGGGESKGVIVNRANPLPMCLPYFHQSGSTSNQYHYLPFIWPAGAAQLYLNHDYCPTTSTSDSYKMSTIKVEFGKDLQLVTPNSATFPMWVNAPVGTADWVTSTNTPFSNTIVSHTGKLRNEYNKQWLNFNIILEASAYLGGTPTEDTICLIRITTTGYSSSASSIGVLTVQEEAFE